MTFDLSIDEIKEAEKTGKLPRKDGLSKTLHFCEEWDFMLIDDTDTEFDCCTCGGIPK